MTWKHVALIVAALFAVVLSGYSSQCSAALPGVVQLSTFIVIGTLGNAGVGGHKAALPAHQKEGSNSNG